MKKMSWLESVRYGFLLPIQSIRLILKHPMLLAWSLIPALITAGLYFWAFSALQAWLVGLASTTLVGFGLEPTGWALTILLFMLQAIIWIFAALTFSIAATLVASPFNDFLAEATEVRCSPPLPPALHQGWRWKLYLMRVDLMKSLLSALGMTLALLTSWIPALNFLSAALAFLLMTFQYVSYAQTRRGHGLIESLKWILLHPASCMSFGAVLTLLFSIPLISVFAIPVAVVGGTLLFAQTQNPTNAVPR